MRKLLPFILLLTVACDDSATGPTTGDPSYFVSGGVSSSASLLNVGEAGYQLRFEGFVSNTSISRLENARVEVRILNAAGDQIGAATVSCVPPAVAPNSFSRFTALLSPYNDFREAASITLVPLSDQTRGFEATQTIFW